MTSIENILNVATLKSGGKLLAGKKGVNKEVQYVTVMEVPDFNIASLDEKSLVLTTMFAHHSSIERINTTIEKLCIQNVSGIIIKLGRYLHEISESTLDIADRFGVPLIAIKGNILFREIIKDVSSEIMREQRAVIDGVNEINEVLINIVLRNDKIYKILEALGERIYACCYCLDINGVIISQYHIKHDEQKCFELESYINTIKSEYETREYDQMSSFNVGEFYVVPCSTQNQTLGFLVITNAHILGEKELLFAKQTTSFLSIKFLEKQLKIETEQRMIASVVDDIIFGKYNDESIIADRLKLLGFEPQKYHQILFLSDRSGLADDRLGIKSNAYGYWKRKILKVFPNAFIFLKGMDYVVILTFACRQILTESDMLKSQLKELIDNDYGTIDIGYSLPVDSLCKISECYDQAQKALQYGRSVNGSERIFAYIDFFEIGLISHSIGSNDNKLLTEKIIRPIRNYDERRKTKLWETLEKSLLEKSLEDAAKSLFVHISTLRYRLDKVKDITNIDFFEPQGKFLFYLAYIADKAALNKNTELF